MAKDKIDTPYPNGFDLFREWCASYGRELGRQIAEDYLEVQKVNEAKYGELNKEERGLCHEIELALETL